MLFILLACDIDNDDNGSRNYSRFLCVKFYLQCPSCFTMGIKFLVLGAAYLWDIFDLMCPLYFKGVQICCFSKIKSNQYLYCWYRLSNLYGYCLDKEYPELNLYKQHLFKVEAVVDVAAYLTIWHEVDEPILAKFSCVTIFPRIFFDQQNEFGQISFYNSHRCWPIVAFFALKISKIGAGLFSIVQDCVCRICCGDFPCDAK